MAVVFALKYFRVYLLGASFTIFTDCAALRTATSKRDLIPRIARWWLEIQDFTFEVKYRPGCKMGHADYLSRHPVMNINQITNITEEEWIKAVQIQDAKLNNIIQALEGQENSENKNYFKHFSLKRGILFRKVENTLKWIVPQSSRWLICKLNHDDCGHLGFIKTCDRIKKHYWFPQMSRFVKKYVSACLNCTYMKSKKGIKPGLLNPIKKGTIPFETIHVDHLGPFVKSRKKNTHLFILVDGFTKFVFLEPVKATSVKYVIKALNNFIEIFGVPTRVISDRGSAFTSESMKLYCQELGIKHVLNAVASPRANGQCERYNQVILDSLKCVTINDKDELNWDTHVKQIQFSLNTHPNATTGESPYKILMGIEPKHWADSFILNAIGETITRSNLTDLRAQVGERVEIEQQKQKIYFDKKRSKPIKFVVGDLVMHRRTQVSATGMSHKLEPVYKGPYRVTHVLPNDRYALQDLRGKKLTMMLAAVDNLKPWVVLNAEQDQPFE